MTPVSSMRANEQATSYHIWPVANAVDGDLGEFATMCRINTTACPCGLTQAEHPAS